MELKPGNYSVWSPCITAHMNSGKRQHQPEGKYKERKIKKQNECQNSTTSRPTVCRRLFKPHLAARVVNQQFIFILFGLPHRPHALYIISSHVNLNKKQHEKLKRDLSYVEHAILSDWHGLLHCRYSLLWTRINMSWSCCVNCFQSQMDFSTRCRKDFLCDCMCAFVVSSVTCKN